MMPANALAIVSIHATLAGGDPHSMVLCRAGRSFYPRHPRGWRRQSDGESSKGVMFLSTPPSRVATHTLARCKGLTVVSIHATLAGGDDEFAATRAGLNTFLSTPPSRVATRENPRRR